VSAEPTVAMRTGPLSTFEVECSVCGLVEVATSRDQATRVLSKHQRLTAHQAPDDIDWQDPTAIDLDE
jgi:hypothetical protein